MTRRGQPIRCCLATAFTALAVVFVGLGMHPAFANPASHEKKPDAKHQVETLEEQWRVAELAGDMRTMEKMLSDDYLGISMTGEVDTKGQQLRRAADRKLVLSKIELSDMKVKLVGDVAIVTSRAQVEGTNDGIPVRGMFRYTRIYQHLPTGQWKITSFEATRERKHRQGTDEKAAEVNAQQGSGQNE